MGERTSDLQQRIHLFIKQYGRKRRRGFDPNDRHYDRKLEHAIKRMDPRELDGLIRQDEGESPS